MDVQLLKAHVQLVELMYSVLAQCQKNRWKLAHSIPLFQKQYRECLIHFFIYMTKSNYENLLKRIEDKLGDSNAESSARFELPIVDIMWEGQKTFLRNFSEFPNVLRRDPDKVLQYLSKEFAVPAERLGDKAMFVGRRAPDDFTRLFQIYVKDYVECPTCKSPDTKILKENRISFLICEACGAKSTLKGKYA